MADAFLDDDAPAVMVTPGPTGLAPIPAVSMGAVVGPARKALRIMPSSTRPRRVPTKVATPPPFRAHMLAFLTIMMYYIRKTA